MRTKNFFPTFVMLFTLLACRSPQTSFSNSHYSNEIDVASNYQIAWQDLLKQEEENYLVFVYSEWCNNCHDIWDDVISFVNQKAITLYFVDINRSINNIPISADIESTYGAKEVGEISIMGTPTILEIFNGVLFANVGGKQACLNLLSEKRLNIGL
ncbi:MAG: hypothetical protein GXY27_04635 [Erysipelotrichaceae bacterium]|nr:hypothetical protein [Erysipelotrichaceae bacterium]